MKAIGFNHVSIPARDVDETVRFYEEVFGLERIPTYNFGFRSTYLRCGDLQLHVFESDDPPHGGQHFALDVDDFHAVHARATALGYLDDRHGAAIRELPDGAVQMYLRDPAGNLVEVDWPDVATLDRARLPGLVRLADQHPQEGENRAATLYLRGAAGEGTR